MPCLRPLVRHKQLFRPYVDQLGGQLLSDFFLKAFVSLNLQCK